MAKEILMSMHTLKSCCYLLFNLSENNKQFLVTVLLISIKRYSYEAQKDASILLDL